MRIGRQAQEKMAFSGTLELSSRRHPPESGAAITHKIQQQRVLTFTPTAENKQLLPEEEGWRWWVFEGRFTPPFDIRSCNCFRISHPTVKVEVPKLKWENWVGLERWTLRYCHG